MSKYIEVPHAHTALLACMECVHVSIMKSKQFASFGIFLPSTIIEIVFPQQNLTQQRDSFFLWGGGGGGGGGGGITT